MTLRAEYFKMLLHSAWLMQWLLKSKTSKQLEMEIFFYWYCFSHLIVNILMGNFKAFLFIFYY